MSKHKAVTLIIAAIIIVVAFIIPTTEQKSLYKQQTRNAARISKLTAKKHWRPHFRADDAKDEPEHSVEVQSNGELYAYNRPAQRNYRKQSTRNFAQMQKVQPQAAINSMEQDLRIRNLMEEIVMKSRSENPAVVYLSERNNFSKDGEELSAVEISINSNEDGIDGGSDKTFSINKENFEKFNRESPKPMENSGMKAVDTNKDASSLNVANLHNKNGKDDKMDKVLNSNNREDIENHAVAMDFSENAQIAYDKRNKSSEAVEKKSTEKQKEVTKDAVSVDGELVQNTGKETSEENMKEFSTESSSNSEKNNTVADEVNEKISMDTEIDLEHIKSKENGDNLMEQLFNKLLETSDEETGNTSSKTNHTINYSTAEERPTLDAEESKTTEEIKNLEMEDINNGNYDGLLKENINTIADNLQMEVAHSATSLDTNSTTKIMNGSTMKNFAESVLTSTENIKLETNSSSKGILNKTVEGTDESEELFALIDGNEDEGNTFNDIENIAHNSNTSEYIENLAGNVKNMEALETEIYGLNTSVAPELAEIDKLKTAIQKTGNNTDTKLHSSKTIADKEEEKGEIKNIVGENIKETLEVIEEPDKEKKKNAIFNASIASNKTIENIDAKDETNDNSTKSEHLKLSTVSSAEIGAIKDIAKETMENYKKNFDKLQLNNTADVKENYIKTFGLNFTELEDFVRSNEMDTDGLNDMTATIDDSKELETDIKSSDIVKDVGWELSAVMQNLKQNGQENMMSGIVENTTHAVLVNGDMNIAVETTKISKDISDENMKSEIKNGLNDTEKIMYVVKVKDKKISADEAMKGLEKSPAAETQKNVEESVKNNLNLSNIDEKFKLEHDNDANSITENIFTNSNIGNIEALKENKNVSIIQEASNNDADKEPNEQNFDVTDEEKENETLSQEQTRQEDSSEKIANTETIDEMTANIEYYESSAENFSHLNDVEEKAEQNEEKNSNSGNVDIKTDFEDLKDKAKEQLQLNGEKNIVSEKKNEMSADIEDLEYNTENITHLKKTKETLEQNIFETEKLDDLATDIDDLENDEEKVLVITEEKLLQNRENITAEIEDFESTAEHSYHLNKTEEILNPSESEKLGYIKADIDDLGNVEEKIADKAEEKLLQNGKNITAENTAEHSYHLNKTEEIVVQNILESEKLDDIAADIEDLENGEEKISDKIEEILDPFESEKLDDIKANIGDLENGEEIISDKTEEKFKENSEEEFKEEISNKGESFIDHKITTEYIMKYESNTAAASELMKNEINLSEIVTRLENNTEANTENYEEQLSENVEKPQTNTDHTSTEVISNQVNETSYSNKVVEQKMSQQMMTLQNANDANVKENINNATAPGDAIEIQAEIETDNKHTMDGNYIKFDTVIQGAINTAGAHYYNDYDDVAIEAPVLEKYLDDALSQLEHGNNNETTLKDEIEKELIKLYETNEENFEDIIEDNEAVKAELDEMCKEINETLSGNHANETQTHIILDNDDSIAENKKAETTLNEDGDEDISKEGSILLNETEILSVLRNAEEMKNPEHLENALVHSSLEAVIEDIMESNMESNMDNIGLNLSAYEKSKSPVDIKSSEAMDAITKPLINEVKQAVDEVAMHNEVKDSVLAAMQKPAVLMTNILDKNALQKQLNYLQLNGPKIQKQQDVIEMNTTSAKPNKYNETEHIQLGDFVIGNKTNIDATNLKNINEFIQSLNLTKSASNEKLTAKVEDIMKDMLKELNDYAENQKKIENIIKELTSVTNAEKEAKQEFEYELKETQNVLQLKLIGEDQDLGEYLVQTVDTSNRAVGVNDKTQNSPQFASYMMESLDNDFENIKRKDTNEEVTAQYAKPAMSQMSVSNTDKIILDKSTSVTKLNGNNVQNVPEAEYKISRITQKAGEQNVEEHIVQMIDKHKSPHDETSTKTELHFHSSKDSIGSLDSEFGITETKDAPQESNENNVTSVSLEVPEENVDIMNFDESTNTKDIFVEPNAGETGTNGTKFVHLTKNFMNGLKTESLHLNQKNEKLQGTKKNTANSMIIEKITEETSTKATMEMTAIIPEIAQEVKTTITMNTLTTIPETEVEAANADIQMSSAEPEIIAGSIKIRTEQLNNYEEIKSNTMSSGKDILNTTALTDQWKVENNETANASAAGDSSIKTMDTLLGDTKPLKLQNRRTEDEIEKLKHKMEEQNESSDEENLDVSKEEELKHKMEQQNESSEEDNLDVIREEELTNTDSSSIENYDIKEINTANAEESKGKLQKLSEEVTASVNCFTSIEGEYVNNSEIDENKGDVDDAEDKIASMKVHELIKNMQNDFESTTKHRTNNATDETTAYVASYVAVDDYDAAEQNKSQENDKNMSENFNNNNMKIFQQKNTKVGNINNAMQPTAARAKPIIIRTMTTMTPAMTTKMSANETKAEIHNDTIKRIIETKVNVVDSSNNNNNNNYNNYNNSSSNVNDKLKKAKVDTSEYNKLLSENEEEEEQEEDDDFDNEDYYNNDELANDEADESYDQKDSIENSDSNKNVKNQSISFNSGKDEMLNPNTAANSNIFAKNNIFYGRENLLNQQRQPTILSSTSATARGQQHIIENKTNVAKQTAAANTDASTSNNKVHAANTAAAYDTLQITSYRNGNKKDEILSDMMPEITTTNWWHTLPYTEIRNFLNAIFDSATARAAAHELYEEITRKSKTHTTTTTQYDDVDQSMQKETAT